MDTTEILTSVLWMIFIFVLGAVTGRKIKHGVTRLFGKLFKERFLARRLLKELEKAYGWKPGASAEQIAAFHLSGDVTSAGIHLALNALASNKTTCLAIEDWLEKVNVIMFKSPEPYASFTFKSFVITHENLHDVIECMTEYEDRQEKETRLRIAGAIGLMQSVGEFIGESKLEAPLARAAIDNQYERIKDRVSTDTPNVDGLPDEIRAGIAFTICMVDMNAMGGETEWLEQYDAAVREYNEALI